MQIGTFKQRLLLCHNKMNLEVLGQGLQRQKVELLEDKALFTAVNRRLPSLAVLESFDPLSSKTMEVGLMIRMKEVLRATIKEDLGIEIKYVFKDYDRVSEVSISVVFFDRMIEEILATI